MAVTGTIDPDGNVGPVGGVKQKTFAVRDAGATVFLVPHDEFAEAQKWAGPDLKIVEVNTLDEALQALADNGGNTANVNEKAAGTPPPPATDGLPERPGGACSLRSRAVAYNPHLSSNAPGDLDPDAVASREFAEARRGYEPTEVQAYLQVMAEEVRAGRQREHELRLQIADLERQLLDTEERAAAAESRTRAAESSYAARRLAADPRGGPAHGSGLSLQALDEVQLTILVGEETAKVLAAARNAASEIRANAERTAAEMHRKATASADEVVARGRRRARAAGPRGRGRAGPAARRDRRRHRPGARPRPPSSATGSQAEADAAAAACSPTPSGASTTPGPTPSGWSSRPSSDAGEQRARAEADGAESIVAQAHETGRQLVAEAQAIRTRMLEDLAPPAQARCAARSSSCTPAVSASSPPSSSPATPWRPSTTS